MAKITIPNILSSFASVTQLNNSFQSIEDALNDKVLYRDNPLGEPNTMLNDLDMNSRDVINVGGVSAQTIVVGGVDLTASVIAAESAATAAQASQAASANSESNAASSAAQAEAARIDIEAQYLGAKASDPVLDNEGAALQEGALYFNSTDDVLRVYNGTSWQPAPASATDVSFSPAGAVGSTDVQSAIEELDAEKAPNSHTHVEADITDLDKYSQAQADAAFVNKDSDTGAADLPTGTTAQRPASPIEGMFRRNTETSSFEGYDGSAWTGVGGASGGAGNPFVYEHQKTVSADYTIVGSNNAISGGPLTINGGVTVTVESGATWTIVGG